MTAKPHTPLTDLLDQIDRLDKKSTPGKWVAHEGMLKNHEGWSIFVDEHNHTVTSATPGDAEFIALARTALPKLAEAVYQVLALLDALKREASDPDWEGIAQPGRSLQELVDHIEHGIRADLLEGDDD